MAVYFSALKPGDRILTMDLSHGGHLTHGNKANFSGRFYEVTHYGVDRETERIDYDSLARLAEEHRPRMITAGASAYSRIIDFKRCERSLTPSGLFSLSILRILQGWWRLVFIRRQSELLIL